MHDDQDPTPNGPADLGWTPTATTRPARAPLTFPVPPAAPQRPCRSCRALVVWIVTASGRKMPVDPATGASHFSTCPDAGAHRRPR